MAMDMDKSIIAHESMGGKATDWLHRALGSNGLEATCRTFKVPYCTYIASFRWQGETCT
jgi:hypothetical protein